MSPVRNSNFAPRSESSVFLTAAAKENSVEIFNTWDDLKCPRDANSFFGKRSIRPFLMGKGVKVKVFGVESGIMGPFC